MTEPIILPVIIEKVIFRSESFAILAGSLNAYSSRYKPELEELVKQNTKKNKYNNFTIATNMLGDHEEVEGMQYVFSGEFFNHKKFGPQFKSDFCFVDSFTNEDGLLLYLQHLPNIKASRSAAIIEKYGVEETIRILNEEPNKLAELNIGLNIPRIAKIKEKWDEDNGKCLREMYTWLLQHNIPPKTGKDIYKVWKENSLKILQENPYRITELDGFGFIKADEIAHKIFKNVPKDFRTLACMRWVMDQQVYKNSNLCVPFKTFRDIVIDELRKGSSLNAPHAKFNEQEYRGLVNICIKKNLDVFSAVKNIEDDSQYIYLKDIWDKEKFIATSIFERRHFEDNKTDESKETDKEREGFAFEDKDLDDAQKDVSEFYHRPIILDETQKNAVRSCFDNKITVITGAGGTGKSMICRCVYHLAQQKRLSVRFMSPTGRAAKVLSLKTAYPAQTIHRSLKLKPGDEFAKEPIREDIVLIDEVSMVGIDTMFAVMQALQENLWAHIVFVGDPNQLPSVSPGNFLTDIIASQCANVVKLDKIHRQSEDSYIPLLANDIAKGNVVTIPDNAADIKWHSLSHSEPFQNIIRRIIPKYMEGNDMDDLQIISPMYKGEYGINKINEIMQELMAEHNNEKDRPFKKGFALFYVGDRVLQTVNNYDKEVYNGDIGKIMGAGRKVMDANVSDQSEDYVTVDYDGQRITYIEKEIEEIKLAWCISIHKFQGSQSPNIILVLSNEANRMATKELVYTAMTRAEKYLSIYGHMDAFRTAPTKSAVLKRYTNMNGIIRELRENKQIFRVLE